MAHDVSVNILCFQIIYHSNLFIEIVRGNAKVDPSYTLPFA